MMKCPKCGKERDRTKRKYEVSFWLEDFCGCEIEVYIKEIERLKPFEEMVKNMLIYFDTNKEEIKAAGMTNYEVVELIKKLRVRS